MRVSLIEVADALSTAIKMHEKEIDKYTFIAQMITELRKETSKNQQIYAINKATLIKKL